MMDYKYQNQANNIVSQYNNGLISKLEMKNALTTIKRNVDIENTGSDTTTYMLNDEIVRFVNRRIL